MLVYPDPPTAVDVGSRIIAAMKQHDAPAVHASAHTGTAIAREGDYFGSAVNLAARLLNAAGENELVATVATAEAEAADRAWEPAGSVRVRGVTDAVALLRLRC